MKVAGKGPEHASERGVFDSLESVLDDTWTGIAGAPYRLPNTRWSSDPPYGDADVLAVSPNFGVVHFEAKGGIYAWDGSGLRTRGGKAIEPTPIQQALKFRDFVLQVVKPRIERCPRVPMHQFVAFPDMHRVEPFGTADARGSVLFKPDLQPAHLQRLVASLQPWSGPEKVRARFCRELVETLAPTTKEKPLSWYARTLAEAQREEAVRSFDLHAAQLETFRAHQHARRTVTLGPAGTGKSLIALRLARQLARNGLRVLFFTPNAIQAQDVQVALRDSGTLYEGNVPGPSPGVWVRSLPGLITRSANQIFEASDRFRDAILEEVIEAGDFDAVIVDEFQDVPTELLESFEVSLAPAGELHLFGDGQQRTLPGDAQVPDGYQFIALEQVWRSTDRIYELAARTAARPGLAPLNMPGSPIVTVPAATPEAAGTATADLMARVVAENSYRSLDVQVLYDDREQDWCRRFRTTLMPLLRRRKRQPPMPRPVHDFRGLEAPVIIYVTGAALADQGQDLTAYVAATRASQLLAVIGPNSATYA